MAELLRPEEKMAAWNLLGGGGKPFIENTSSSPSTANAADKKIPFLSRQGRENR